MAGSLKHVAINAQLNNTKYLVILTGLFKQSVNKNSREDKIPLLNTNLPSVVIASNVTVTEHKNQSKA